MFPSLKDLIVQKRINQEIIDEIDPKRARAAIDLLKKQQQEII